MMKKPNKWTNYKKKKTSVNCGPPQRPTAPLQKSMCSEGVGDKSSFIVAGRLHFIGGMD